MTRLAIALVAGLGLASTGPIAQAAKAAHAKAAKGEPPSASAAELNKLKGDYKWDMTPDEVIAKVQERVRASYEDRLKKTTNDPTKNDRVRKEMFTEIEGVKSKVITFDGKKSGYDVSIIDQEFLHNAGESMLVAKEDSGTRYFFFNNGRLYKMFIAFDKQMLQGKSFREFGQLMQARFGKAREVNTEEKTKAGVKMKLDHFEWSSKGGDMLRLVDRSEFYDVYCLVIYDGNIARQQAETRRSRGTEEKKDSLVEAVTTRGVNENDPNDNVLDQITGKHVGKPGDERGAAIVVPSQSGAKAPKKTDTEAVIPSAQPAAPAKTEDKPKAGGKADERKGLNL